MKDARSIISDSKKLQNNFHHLNPGDIIKGRIPLKNGEEHLLLDLVERGIRLIPSAASQLASRSKTFQARVLNQWMLPHTFAVYDRHQLLEHAHIYHEKGIGRVILKQDRKNAGIGILLYNNIEEIYNQAASNMLVYPFVIQPFLENATDLRIIMVGEYTEGYKRVNPSSFRNNLHCGGRAESITVSPEIQELSRTIMKRGKFPYGFLDFMLEQTGRMHLSEINLRGGLRGARITTGEFKDRVAAEEKRLVEKIRSANFH